MNSAVQIRPDTYYFDASRAAITDAVADAQARGITDPEVLSKFIRRAYPFGQTDAGSRPYKIYSKLVAAVEKSLGLPPRKHASTIEREQNEAPKAVAIKKKGPLIETRSELYKIEPKDHESAAFFLRNYTTCVTTNLPDVDRIRVVVRSEESDGSAIKWQKTCDVEIGDHDAYQQAHLKIAHAAWAQFAEVIDGTL